MFRKSIFIFALIGFQNVFAQNDTIIILKKELMKINSNSQGEFFEFYDSQKTKIKRHGYLFNGFNDSVCNEYSHKGKLINDCFYKNGKLISYHNYDENGFIRNDSLLLNGNGAVIIRNEKGQICSIEHYKDGLMSGIRIVYVPKSGKIIFTEQYLNGNIDGLKVWADGDFIEFYENGKMVWSKMFFKSPKTQVKYFAKYQAPTQFIQYKKNGKIKKVRNNFKWN